MDMDNFPSFLINLLIKNIISIQIIALLRPYMILHVLQMFIENSKRTSHEGSKQFLTKPRLGFCILLAFVLLIVCAVSLFSWKQPEYETRVTVGTLRRTTSPQPTGDPRTSHLPTPSSQRNDALKKIDYYVDRRIDPCKDFFQFACNSEKRGKISKLLPFSKKSISSNLTELILEAPLKFQFIKKFYQSCIAMAQNNLSTSEWLKKVVSPDNVEPILVKSAKNIKNYIRTYRYQPLSDKIILILQRFFQTHQIFR